MAALEEIVTRLAGRFGPLRDSPQPLDGGITNRNYRVAFGADEYVIRFPGKETDLLGISREAERIAGAAAAELGIAPELVAAEADCTVTRFLRARALSPGELASDPAPIANALRAFHESGTRLPVKFWVPDLLDEYARVVRSRGGELSDAYGRAQELVGRIATVLPLSHPVACHNDLLPGNLMLVDPDGPAVAPMLMLVDWEYAGMGHPLFDLGNLAVNNELDASAGDRLLAAYFGERPGPARRAALELMRIMSDAREAAWGVVQSVISELDFDFDAYAARHFSRLAQAASSPSFEEWLGAAAA